MFGLSPVTYAALLVTLALAVYKTFIYPIFLSPLAKVPAANFWASFTGAWIWWKRFRECDSQAVHRAHMVKSDIIRLSPYEISVNCVEGGTKVIYKFDKHLWYSVFENFGIRTMFGSLRKRQHAPIRRQISKIYTKDEVLSRPVFEEVCSEIVYNRWIPLLESCAETDEPVDVYELDLAITFDLSAAYIYGLPNVTNFLLDKAERRHWQDNYKVLKKYMFYGQEMYITTTDLLPRWGINPMPKKLDEAVKNLEEKGAQLAERIDERHRDGLADDNEGILYHQLRNTSKGVEGLDDELEQKKRASEMIDHCFAGHGTASIVLTYMYHHLSIYPEYQRLLRKELQTLDERPTQKQVDTLQFLEGIILETLRLFPSPPAGQPRITPEGGCALGSYSDIPGGIRVSAQAYSLHRNENVFPEAERWWPERWTPFFGDEAKAQAADDAARESEHDRISEMHQWYLGFGQGTRACPGKDYGMLGIKAIMAATYSKFESRLASDDDMRQMDGNSEGQPAGQRCLISFKPLRG